MDQSETTQTTAPGVLPNPPGAVGSLVCGILSIVLCWVPIAGLVLGIIAIVLASKGKKAVLASPGTYNEGGMRIAGFVCGIIGTVFSGLYTIYWVAFVAFVAEHGDTFRDGIRDGLEEWKREMERQPQPPGK